MMLSVQPEMARVHARADQRSDSKVRTTIAQQQGDIEQLKAEREQNSAQIDAIQKALISIRQETTGLRERQDVADEVAKMMLADIRWAEQTHVVSKDLTATVEKSAALLRTEFMQEIEKLFNEKERTQWELNSLSRTSKENLEHLEQLGRKLEATEQDQCSETLVLRGRVEALAGELDEIQQRVNGLHRTLEEDLARRNTESTTLQGLLEASSLFQAANPTASVHKVGGSAESTGDAPKMEPTPGGTDGNKNMFVGAATIAELRAELKADLMSTSAYTQVCASDVKSFCKGELEHTTRNLDYRLKKLEEMSMVMSDPIAAVNNLQAKVEMNAILVSQLFEERTKKKAPRPSSLFSEHLQRNDVSRGHYRNKSSPDRSASGSPCVADARRRSRSSSSSDSRKPSLSGRRGLSIDVSSRRSSMQSSCANCSTRLASPMSRDPGRLYMSQASLGATPYLQRPMDDRVSNAPVPQLLRSGGVPARTHVVQPTRLVEPAARALQALQSMNNVSATNTLASAIGTVGRGSTSPITRGRMA